MEKSTRFPPSIRVLFSVLVGLVLWSCLGTVDPKEPRTIDIAITEKNDSLLLFDSLEILLHSQDNSVLQVILRGKLKSRDQLLNIPLNAGIGDSFTVSIKGFKGGKLAMDKQVDVSGSNEFVVKEIPIQKDTAIVKPDTIPVKPDTIPVKPDTIPVKPLPPVLEATADTTIHEGQLVVLTVKLTNATDSAVDIKSESLPKGSSFRMNGRFQGEFSWRPDFDQSQAMDYAVTFSVKAGISVLEKTVRIKVLNTNRAPAFSPIKNQVAKENERLAFAILATDLDGNGGLVISIDSLPRGSIFSKDTFSWTPEYNQAGNYSLKFTVTDGDLKDSQSVAVTVGDYNRPPDIEVGDTTIAENDSLALRVFTTDPDGQAPKLKATGLPQGSELRAIDSLQGEWIFSWKPSYTQGKSIPYEVAFVSSDDSLKTTKTIKIAVKNVNRPPTASAGKDSSITINDIISLRGMASDPDDPVTKMEWDIGGSGSFVRVSKADTNIKAPSSALPAFICVFKVTDGDGATAIDSVLFKVTAETPIAKVGADTTVDPGKEIRLKGTATDDGKLVEKSWSCNGSAALSPSIDGNEAVLKIGGKDDSLYTCIFKVVDDDGMSSADTIQVKAKLNWTMATDSAAFRGRDGAATVVFKDRMWVIGGSSFDGERFSDIWSSADGKSWRLETDVAECLPRYGHTVLEFGGKLWLVGGAAPIGSSIFKSQSDIWSSFDGVSWTRVKDSAGFTPRENHSAVVFDNKMWIMGGQDTRKVAKTLGDTWYSADGANWVLANATAFPPRVYHKSVVTSGKIWIVGGFQKSDILSSQDGTTWINQEIQKPFYPATHFFQVTVHAGQIWAWEDNQVWLTSDMSTWGESTASAPFVGRLAPLVYHGKLWCFGGLTKGTKVVHSVWSNTPN